MLAEGNVEGVKSEIITWAEAQDNFRTEDWENDEVSPKVFQREGFVYFFSEKNWSLPGGIYALEMQGHWKESEGRTRELTEGLVGPMTTLLNAQASKIQSFIRSLEKRDVKESRQAISAASHNAVEALEASVAGLPKPDQAF